ncbi:MAG: IS110 family transposase [Bacteroidota bacterium]|nr:IS110 family transposase [Bacteroidota bacterium]
MKKSAKKLSFAGINIYIGIDVHKNNWTVSIYVNDHEHKTFSQNPEPLLLVTYLDKHFPDGSYHIVYEAGYCGFWIYEKFKACGIDCMVVHPADVPTTDKEKRQKNNRVDCRKLARSLSNGELTAIYVPHRDALEDRSLIRSRRNLVKQQTRYKNRIKAMLSHYGIIIPEHFGNSRWSGQFINWLEEIEMNRPAGKMALQIEVDELKRYRTQIATVNREIRKLAKTDLYQKRVDNLLTIPGVGIITAMTLLTEIVDINRFASSDKFAAFIGLIAGERSSGEEDNVTHTKLTSRCNKYLRSMLIESAWVAVRKDPALMLYYHKAIKRMKASKAIIRVTRKLLNRIRFVLKNNQEYVPAVIQ